ncbi:MULTISPECIES: hypothetical protein [Hymenobacter]|uniref:1-acyl-sn-glycerol-3-phosphate acyltransferase n=3 Tax=Hymenobacter TaxID=89966 RepID=A0ABR7MJS9_9BACT|nr:MULTISPECIES: hypothetical protein [Hymenobacter]MBC6611342.1 hypothetical protein [Hymenobacter citatus]MBO3269031.1 hypothetical protein [Hymenobacter defluvii]MBW3130643.1 hypothetical protein [Hymenobacter profundi]QNE38704.1 hypothetical protein F1C16_03605 [Hymenobacter sp. NBH84]
MHAPTTIPLLRRLLSWLGYVLFQLVLVVLYGLHLIRAFRSPFRANELPPRQLRPRFWARPAIG